MTEKKAGRPKSHVQLSNEAARVVKKECPPAIDINDYVSLVVTNAFDKYVSGDQERLNAVLSLGHAERYLQQFGLTIVPDPINDARFRWRQRIPRPGQAAHGGDTAWDSVYSPDSYQLRYMAVAHAVERAAVMFSELEHRLRAAEEAAKPRPPSPFDMG